MASLKCNKFPTRIIIRMTFLIAILTTLWNHRLGGGNNLSRDILKSQFSRFDNSFQPLPKRILFWTPFFGGRELRDYNIFQDEGNPLSQKSFCKYQCEFTTNRSLLNSSHAVLFHGRDLGITVTTGGKYIFSHLPQQRMGDQHWIFYLFESPVHSVTFLDKFDNIFNLTLSYRTDSDIFVPYKRLLKHASANPKNSNSGVRVEKELLINKTKLAAWIISSCKLRRARNSVARKLMKYIPIDVYGKCGNHSCSPPIKGQEGNCYKEIGKSYKFYLSFENSLCQDYVTEKFFNALEAGMVPIVYGRANYLRHAPEGSFINVNSFPSVKALADYILMLDQNPQEYLKYFEWRETFFVDPIHGLARAWCTLCGRLTKGYLPRYNVVRYLANWWFHKNNAPACIHKSEGLRAIDVIKYLRTLSREVVHYY